MRGDKFRTADRAHAPVRRKDNNRGNGHFQSAVEVREAFDVKHVCLLRRKLVSNFNGIRNSLYAKTTYLVYEEDAWHELRHTLVDVLAHDLVDLAP